LIDAIPMPIEQIASNKMQCPTRIQETRRSLPATQYIQLAISLTVIRLLVGFAASPIDFIKAASQTLRDHEHEYIQT
jgi:hypothetical protein